MSKQTVPLVPNEQYRRVPSRTGVGEAKLFSACLTGGTGTSSSSALQSSFPLASSTPSTRSERPLLIAVVIQACVGESTGELQPSPGSAVFQRTFSVSLHFSGTFSAPA